MRALITGMGGFVGRYLASHLLACEIEVAGTTRGRAEEVGPELRERTRVFPLDMLERGEVRRALDESAPDLVFHLAAQSSVALAWKDPEGTLRANLFGALNLLEAIAASGARPRIVLVGSQEVYGLPSGPEDLPFKETHPLRPTNPYGVSKAAQDLMGYQYFISHDLPVIRVRPFNHIGPGQTDTFVASAFARQVAEVEAGLREPVIQVGNLEAMRDFSDVRDVVRAYHLLATGGEPGQAYNVGSGRAVSVQSLLDLFVTHCKVRVRVERDPARYRPVDVPQVWGDTSKIRDAVGWAPAIPLERTLADVLEYWRARVRDTVHHKGPQSP